VKVEYFQDDIFPDTKVTWEPALSAADWFSGNFKAVITVTYRLTRVVLFFMEGRYEMMGGVYLSFCRVPRPDLRTERPMKPKIGRMETHHTSNLFKGQGHR